MYGAALAYRAPHPDRPARQMEQLLADRGPESGAAVAARSGAVFLHERLEDARVVLGSHADAGVSHLEGERRSLDSRQHADRGGDVPALGEFHRVAEQIDDDLAQSQTITEDEGVHVERNVAD